MKIPEETIKDILMANPIEDVIGEYVGLRENKLGDKVVHLSGDCPFHHGILNSLRVYPAKQTYRCLVCNEAGNVISFVMRADKLNFHDAIRKLAKIAGIELKGTEE